MSFGQNLQFLRKMHEGMTQEALAERMGVSLQRVSKWEMDSAFPEMEKAVALSELFSCSLDELLRGNMNSGNEAYTGIRVEDVPPFRYVRHIVISSTPEDDAIKHMTDWATASGIKAPEIIGLDFPYVTPEQINVHHMHGYLAACVLPPDFHATCADIVIIAQAKQRYAVITIKEPFAAPFSLIPNAYKTLMRYMDINGLKHREAREVLPCFEKVYKRDGATCMDVFIAVDN